MIVATAGHVDHGKSALIKRLTGVDTDRLEEEKRRGLSIILGYAYHRLPDAPPIGFIDVPGHHRFLNTMIAGVNGIDLAMLVVAADDGLMPQTVEHLNVLRLLGVEDFLLVISKIDRVEEERVAEVEARLRDLLSAHGLAQCPLYRVSNYTGDGIAGLLRFLEQRARTQQLRQCHGLFRLSIDRSFHLKGAGLVVTGTVLAGRVSSGESLRLLPQDKNLRVRGIHVQDEPAQTAQAGQRCALNLAGEVEKSDLQRGDWLVSPAAGPVTRRLDAEVEVLSEAGISLRHLAPLRMHIGARRVAGKLYLLGSSAGRRGLGGETGNLHAGESAWVQLILDQPICCVAGERFLLRDDSESLTLGGGQVLDPYAPRTGKSGAGRVEFLKCMQQGAPEQVLAALLNSRRPVDFSRFQASFNLTAGEAEALLGEKQHRFVEQDQQWLIAQAPWRSLQQEIVQRINHWHDGHPQQPGIRAAGVAVALKLAVPGPLLRAALKQLLGDGKLELREGLLSCAGRNTGALTDAQQRWRKVEAALRECGNDIPLNSRLADMTGIDSGKLASTLHTAARHGLVRQLIPNRHVLSGVLDEMAETVLAMAAADQALTVINFKGRIGTGRKVAIEVLEYFDRVGFTERCGDLRVVLKPALPAPATSQSVRVKS